MAKRRRDCYPTPSTTSCEAGFTGCCSEFFLITRRLGKEKSMFQQYRNMLPYRGLLALMVLIRCAPEIRTPKYTTEPNWTAENPLASTGASEGSSRIVSRSPTSAGHRFTKKRYRLRVGAFRFPRRFLQSEIRRLLHRQVCRLGALQNFTQKPILSASAEFTL